MIATESGVSCARCKRRDVTPLAVDGDRQRFNCQGCGENFWGPAIRTVDVEVKSASTEPRFAYVPIGIPDEGAKIVAGKCPKCLKPYLRLGKKYEEHLAACDGTPWVEPKKRGPRKQAQIELAPEPSVIYERQIAALKAQRAALEAQIRGIDLAIAEIEKLKGAGGAAPTPFAPTSTPKSSLSA